MLLQLPLSCGLRKESVKKWLPAVRVYRAGGEKHVCIFFYDDKNTHKTRVAQIATDSGRDCLFNSDVALTQPRKIKALNLDEASGLNI